MKKLTKTEAELKKSALVHTFQWTSKDFFYQKKSLKLNKNQRKRSLI